jgi:predicted regulator of Ras-like GTPase activity (Roadblock/LC7/MglB family)
MTRVERAPAKKERSKNAASGDRSRRRAKNLPERDQDRSVFTQILDRLVRLSPGAVGAALVDREGETVDYAGHVDAFEIKVAAAHWQIVLTTAAVEQPNLGDLRQITVHARARSYLVRKLPDDYAVVLVLHRYAAFAVSARALQEADARLGREAGWPTVKGAAPWCSVDVEAMPKDKSRPARVFHAGAWRAAEIMGSMIGLRAGERGFRVRLSSGVEMMLVRERHGHWFADESIE